MFAPHTEASFPHVHASPDGYCELVAHRPNGTYASGTTPTAVGAGKRARGIAARRCELCARAELSTACAHSLCVSRYVKIVLPFLKKKKKTHFCDSPFLTEAHSDNNENNRSSSPLSSVHEPTDVALPHSESAMLDERDDAAVENLLDSASVAVSAMQAAQGSAMDKANDAGGDEDDDEDEEFARFVQMTLDGIARAHEGLRGVFALTKRNLKAKRIAAAAHKVAAVGEGATAVVIAPGGEPGPVTATH